MYVRPHRSAFPPRVAALLVALTACALLTGSAVDAATRGDIVVVTVRGDATVTMAGMTVPLSAGAILQLPATVRTGADGALELRQGSSTFAVAADTELEIPQSAGEDGLIERIIQIRGNAFYNVGKRSRTRLRVEAPHLVAVIKGTQFNVASRENGTTIALFEGHLEVHAADGSDVVDLHAGEIAIRNDSDVNISILRLAAMRDDTPRDRAVAAAPRSAASSIVQSEMAARIENVAAREAALTEQGEVEAPPSEAIAGLHTSSDPATSSVAATIDSTLVAGNVEPFASAPLEASTPAVDASASAVVDLAAQSIAIGSSTATSTDVPVGAAVNGGAAAIAIAIDTGVTTGAVDVDAGLAGNPGTAGVGAVAEFGNARAAARVSATGGNHGAAVVETNPGVAGDLDVQAGVNAGHGGPSVPVAVGGLDIDLGSEGSDPDLDLQDDDDGDDAARGRQRGRQRK